MPIKRRRSKARDYRITPAAIEAYQKGDYLTVNRMLGVRPWEMSPETADIDNPPPVDGTAWAASWERAVEIRLALEAAAAGRLRCQ